MLLENDGKGKPLRTHNKYYLKFTNDRNDAFRSLYLRQAYNKREASVIGFSSANFTI